jgi:predicted transcriptional regulator YdeE
VIIGSHVELVDSPPTGMIGHTIPAGEFAKVTHLGPQSEIGQTYEFMNRVWSREAGRHFAGHEIEIWDERYQPASPDNEIDLYMALR